MKTILLTVTEHIGRKSGRFTYQAIHMGRVIYEARTDRVYFAITLATDKRKTANGITAVAVNRYGRLDLLLRANIGDMAGVDFVARIDFAEEMDRAKVLTNVQEYMADPNCSPFDWRGDMNDLEHRAFLKEIEAAGGMDRIKQAHKSQKPEATPLVPGEERLIAIVDRTLDAMIEIGIDWEQLKPAFAAVMDAKYLVPESESIADQLQVLMVEAGTTWETAEPIFTGIMNRRMIERLKEIAFKTIIPRDHE